MIPFELVDIGKFFDAELAWENLPFILEGLPMTIAVAFAGMAMGLILGFFLAIGRSSRFFYCDCLRGFISHLCAEHRYWCFCSSCIKDCQWYKSGWMLSPVLFLLSG